MVAMQSRGARRFRYDALLRGEGLGERKGCAMHNILVPMTGLAVLALLALPTSQSAAGPQGGPRPAEEFQSYIEAKLKCGFNDNDKFFCKNVKKKKHHDDDVGHHDKKKHHHDDDDDDNDGDHKKSDKDSKKVLNCEGPNDCGPGYRDLEKPSQYGACCELIKDDTTDEGGDGGKVENAPPPPPPEQDNDRNDLPAACRLVENAQEMDCKAPLDAISCSAVENGKMTCCCVK